jgi:hypothetical protein
MANVIADNYTKILTESDPYEFQYVGWGKALKTFQKIDPIAYADEIEDIVNILESNSTFKQKDDGSFSGWVQDEAYVIMGLAAVGQIEMARNAADWLVSKQGYDTIVGGWKLPNGNEYSEVTSEALQALFTAMPKLYINPSSISKKPSDLNTSFDVYVDVDIHDLLAFDINITWNNDLIQFESFDNSSLNVVWPQGFFEPLPPENQTGPGYFRYAAVATGKPGYTGTNHLFKLKFKIVKAANFQLSTLIHFEMVKLSDSDANPIPATITDGKYIMEAQKPDLEWIIYNPNPSKPFEYGKTFQVKVNATDCFRLKGYNLTIVYNSSLLDLTGVDWTGVLGTGSYTEAPEGTINIVKAADSEEWTGETGFLFTLNFKVNFSDESGHIWRQNNPGPLNTLITFDDATLTFVEGTITKDGITMPNDLSISIRLIQGDVTCNGEVDIFDLRTIAASYDQVNAKYDLKSDGTIDIFDLVLAVANFGYKDP